MATREFETYHLRKLTEKSLAGLEEYIEELWIQKCAREWNWSKEWHSKAWFAKLIYRIFSIFEVDIPDKIEGSFYDYCEMRKTQLRPSGHTRWEIFQKFPDYYETWPKDRTLIRKINLLAESIAAGGTAVTINETEYKTIKKYVGYVRGEYDPSRVD